MKKSDGLFIVLEGLDGSGTTTQATLLHNHFLHKDRKSHLTCEPTDEPVGKLLRDALSGRLSSPNTGQKINFSERARCLLFAADRLEHSAAVEKVISRGVHVICDRYILSSIAYQMLDETISPEWVIEVNTGCAVPDLTIFLHVPVAQCLKRLENRKDSPTVYEKKKFLEVIGRNYKRTLPIYEKHFGLFHLIDGNQPPQKVHESIIKVIESSFRL